MPKFKSTALINDCWSSIGNITFYHRNGQCYWKRKPQPLFPKTPAQVVQQQIHHRAILAWQQIRHKEQLQWNEYANVVPSHRPPYNERHNISGFNLFVSAYHGFAQIGREHIPVPLPYPQFPPSVLELKETTNNNGIIKLICSLTLEDVAQPERWHISARIQLTSNGAGYNPGKMRSYFSSSTNLIVQSHRDSVREECFYVKDIAFSYSLQLHMRYRLIDEVTGYRNNWSEHIVFDIR